MIRDDQHQDQKDSKHTDRARVRDASVVNLHQARVRRGPDPDANNTDKDAGRHGERPDGHVATEPDASADAGTDTAIDPEMSEAAEGGRALVDSPDTQRTPRVSMDGLRRAERRPIVPSYLRSGSEFRDTSFWAVGYAAHTTTYHLTRSPKYAGKLTIRAPYGMVRLVRGTVRWVFDLEAEQVRQATVRREDAGEYLALSKQRDRRVRWRGMVATAGAVTSAGGGTALVLAPEWAQICVGLVALVVFGIAGRPADKPLLDTAVVVPRVSKLTSEVVVRALSVLGIAGINQALSKNPKAVTFTAPITRDGPGWRADVDLPPGVTATEVIDRRDKLAAGLGRPLGCVWPEGNTDVHPGRLVLWVGDQDMSKTRQATWPLAKSGAVDLFRPFAFGTDQRGRLIEVTLMFASMVIGAIPRMGKTFALRMVLLAASLDPRAELHAFDLKGMGDLSPLEPVAHRYRAGADDDDVEYGLDDMRALQAELNRRSKVVRNLPRDLCPENKVTSELASMKSHRLHPIVIGVDECQKWFEHPRYGEELQEICEDLVRRGPAAAMMPIFATQRPDSKSLPTGISGNAVLRYCLKVMGQMENDMVLGTSQYKNGVRATMFSRRDLGIGYLAGEGDDPQIVRAFYLDGPAAERVIARARTLREKAGTLSGHAVGDQPEPAPAHSLLDDIAAVVPVGEGNGKVWSETVVERLAELRPEIYGGWGAEQFAAALKPFGIETAQIGRRIDGKTVNRRGIDRGHVADAITRRNRRREAG